MTPDSVAYCFVDNTIPDGHFLTWYEVNTGVDFDRTVNSCNSEGGLVRRTSNDIHVKNESLSTHETALILVGNVDALNTMKAQIDKP